MKGAAARSLRGGIYLPVLLPALLLLICSLAILSGLEIRVAGGWRTGLHRSQLVGIAVGCGLGAVVLLLPYKRVVRQAYLIYGLSLLLLVLVLVGGVVRNHARRWLSVAGLDFQPSELMKLTLVITLARYIRFRSSYKTFRGLAAPFLITLVPMGLVLLQPDLGTALLFMPVLFTMLFAAGARARHLGLVLVLGAMAIVPLYRWGLEDYQKRRIEGFLVQLGLVAPGDDALAQEMRRRENYQVEQAKVAIGAGGLTGVAEGSAEEYALLRVPEHHNDFIFAAIGHKWGLFGSLLVLGLSVWLALAVLAVAVRQREPAGRLICVGVFALFFFQMFINVAMTVGLMPITGLTLPFLSDGRSSVVVSLVAVALVCNIATRPSFELGRGDFN